MWQDFLKMLRIVQSENAEAKKIAKHLSHILLYELKGVDALYPDLKEKASRLQERMKELGMDIYFSETFRSSKKQDKIFDYVPKVTNAKGLQSYHQYGLAFDAVFVKYNWSPPEGWWEMLGIEGKKLGLEWGGDWGDRPHFEWHPKFTWDKLESYFKRS